MKNNFNINKVGKMVVGETVTINEKGATQSVEPTPKVEVVDVQPALSSPPPAALPHAETWWDVTRQALPEFDADLRALENLLSTPNVDVGSTLNKIRYVTEKVLYTLCTRDSISWGKAEPTLECMIGPLLAKGTIPKNVGIHVRTIQTNASPGSHYQETPLELSHVRHAQCALKEFLDWFRPKAFVEGK
jgi:hypothetical protein